MSKLKVNKEEVLLNINKVFNLTNKLNNPNKKRRTRKSNPDDFVTEWQMVEE